VEGSEELSSDVVKRFVGEGVDEGRRLDGEVLSFGDGRRFQREPSKKKERESSELIGTRGADESASSVCVMTGLEAGGGECSKGSKEGRERG